MFKTKEYKISNHFAYSILAVIILLTALFSFMTVQNVKLVKMSEKQQNMIIRLIKEKEKYQKLPNWYIDAWYRCTDNTQVPKCRMNECLSFEMKLHPIK